MIDMNTVDSLDPFYWYCHYLIICVVSLEVKSDCNLPYQNTDGNYFKSEARAFYTAAPFQKHFGTTRGKCMIEFNLAWRAVSMNIIGNDNRIMECQFFDRMASIDYADNFFLIERLNSSYYEKIDGYVEATSSRITVGSKDDKPGSFKFQLPNGFYKVKLHHVNGGFICKPNLAVEMPFGCTLSHNFRPSYIRLHEDVRGENIAGYGSFNEFEADGISTSFIATSKCLYMKEKGQYSFWHQDDFKDDGKEDDNLGETTFDIYVQLCEVKNACIN